MDLFFGWAVTVCTLQKQNCRYLGVFSEQWDLSLFSTAGIDILVCCMSSWFKHVAFLVVWRCCLGGQSCWYCSASVLFECTAVAILAVNEIQVPQCRAQNVQSFLANGALNLPMMLD